MTKPLNDSSLATPYAALQQAMREAGERRGDWGLGIGDGSHATASLSTLPSSLIPHPRSPILIGASKGQPLERLEEAVALGLRDFGENRVQEALAKWPALKARTPDLRLHLIGPLQTNKVAEAVGLFDVIQTVDRIKLADRLAEELARQGKTPLLLIQVNTGEEPQKAGVVPTEVTPLLAHCRSIGLAIGGLMCVPPADQNPAPHFALMKKMALAHGLSELSMGMSGDFPTAIRLGATMIRVGTALFGHRQGQST